MAVIGKDERELLAYLLASHVDGLQRVASSWGMEFASLLERKSDVVVALCMEAFYGMLDERRNTARYVSILRRMRKSLERELGDVFEDMRTRLVVYVRELVLSEERFNVEWLTAILLLVGDDVSASRIRKLSESGEDGVVKYGTYNGESLGMLFDEMLSQSVGRIYNSVVNGRGGDGELGKSSLRSSVLKALERTARQILVNVTSVVNGIGNDTASMFSMANRSFIEGVMWVTALDEKVCDDCASLEGKVFDPGTEPSCPMHFNCRCHLVPVTLDTEDGII